MDSESEKVSRLLKWCLANGVEIDPRVSIVQNPATGDITVYNSSDEYISDSTTLVTIPKSSILSIRSSSLSQILAGALHSRGIGIPPYGHEAKLTLALALYSELLWKSGSKWEGYLQSLPLQIVPIALFWGYDYEDESSSDADLASSEVRTLIRGTELERGFKNPETGCDVLASGNPTILRRLRKANTVMPSGLSEAGDAYHGLSMVPVADAFNHVQENHIHLESDYDVCTTCGSINECQHDRGPGLVCIEYGSEDEDESRTGNSDDGTCEMVTNSVIAPGSEVFNTYGEGLSNADLLVQYGFILEEEGNENDVVTFEYEELAAIVDGAVEKEVIEEVVCKWGYEAGWEESGEVYNAGKRQEGKREVRFRIDGEGRVSHDLWLFCGMRGSREEGMIERDVAEMKRIQMRMAEGDGGCGYGMGDIQVEKEGGDRSKGRSKGENNGDDSDDEGQRILKKISERIRQIATEKMKGMGGEEAEEEDSKLKPMIQFIRMEQRRILTAAADAAATFTTLSASVRTLPNQRFKEPGHTETSYLQ